MRKSNIVFRAFLATLLSFIVLLKGHANVTGGDAQNFTPNTNGIDYVTVQSSETLASGVFNVGTFFNYSLNSLPYFETVGSGSNQGRDSFNDSFVFGDFHLGAGIFDNLELGFGASYLVRQDVGNTDGLGIFTEGLTDIRFFSKWQVAGDEQGGFALAGTLDLNQVENNPFVGEKGGPTISIEGIVDTTLGHWSLAGNMGYRARNAGKQLSNVTLSPMPDQLIYSGAVSRYIESLDTKLIFEIYGAYPLTEDVLNQTDRELSSLEFLAGAKWDLNRQWALHIGGGTEAYQGASSPDWRMYGGLNWSFGQPEAYKSIEEEPELYPTVDRGEYESLLLPDVFFEFGKSGLSQESKNVMRRIVQRIRAIQKNSISVERLVVEGHTDSVGSSKANLVLSKKRARSVVKLLDQSLAGIKIVAVGKGESEPVATNSNYQGRAKNRRVEIKIYRTKKGG